MTTPFGQKVREMRHETGTTLKDLAEALGVSQAYISALETGRRPRPTPARVDQICAYFGIIWDEAEALKDLARLSQPRITIDTTSLSPDATALANRLSQRIRRLDAKTVRRLLKIME
jgi:transcriptional regulator with XRE-family HTH domain